MKHKPKKIKNKLNFWIINIPYRYILIFLIFVISISTIQSTNPSLPKTESSLPNLEMFGTTYSPAPTTLILENSKLRNFDTDGYLYEKEKYPSKLTSFKDYELRSFYCSDIFSLNRDGNYYSGHATSPAKELTTESRLQSYLQRLLNNPNPNYPNNYSFTSVQYCDIDDARTLLFYRVAGRNETEGWQYVAQMSPGKIVYDNSITAGGSTMSPYACELLAVDKAGRYDTYLLCKSKYFASIEQLDMESGAHQTIKACWHDTPNPKSNYQCWEK